MKASVGVLIVAACLVACTHGYPGSARDSDESNEKNLETVLVLPGANRPGTPLLDIPDSSDFDDDSFEGFFRPSYFYPFRANPFRANPFDGFLSSMQSVMNRLREQMAGILSRIPEQGGVGPFGKIPEGANTTSTTKIIDGHVVTINETTYTDGDDKHGTLIRVRIIDVKPQNDTILMTESEADAEVTTIASLPGTSEREDTTPSRSVETVEDFDNEISKNQDDNLTA